MKPLIHIKNAIAKNLVAFCFTDISNATSVCSEAPPCAGVYIRDTIPLQYDVIVKIILNTYSVKEVECRVIK